MGKIQKNIFDKFREQALVPSNHVEIYRGPINGEQPEPLETRKKYEMVLSSNE